MQAKKRRPYKRIKAAEKPPEDKMRPVTIIYIPYRDFKEKVRLVKEWKKKGYYVEDLGDGIYCMKTKGYKKRGEK